MEDREKAKNIMPRGCKGQKDMWESRYLPSDTCLAYDMSIHLNNE